ncbi:MFS transporter [Streptomyces filamentosus]|uniref:MFS transporter n=2 Tax=Streptomyces filamentosus TaxID=67294 RepID=A0ABY4VAM4_STRFL|nr:MULTISPECIES: MFS transporter [Streptomyces]ESU50447.1 major facilitator superfamily permease [Streptomyces sp. HCCB10043]EWS90026.1 major facilitator superfamily transporter permease [Streptomyces filamentosus NRRL 11379]MYR77044.1 MFS transporter [Streptomyces sp. SID5466]USC51276.1 MFS transporter [Streptomyces filamentosus]
MSARQKSRRLPPLSGVLVLVMASTGLVVIDLTIVAIGLPLISADIGDGASAESVVVTYMVAMGALTQVVGSLSDRWGRRPLFLAGIAVFTLSSLAATVAPDLLWLDVARVVQGAGAAAIMVNGIPLLSDRCTGEERNLAIGAWGSFATAAGLLAPVFGGVLAETFGWRAVFAVNLPLGLAAWVLAVRVLPHAPGTARGTSRSPASRAGSGAGRTDWLGSLLLMLGLGTATLLMLRSGDTPWSGQDTAVLLTACAALAVFLAVQLKVPAPTLELRMFTSPAFSGAMLAVLLSRVLTIGGSVYLVLYFSDGLGMSPTGAGLLMTPIFLAQIVMGMVGSKLIGERPPGLVIGSGYALKGVGLAALALLITPDTPWWALVVPLLAWGAGGGIAGAPVMAVAVRVTAPERVGMVAGTVSTLASLGAGVGTAALGAVFALRGGSGAEAVTDGARAVLAVSAALAVVAVLTAVTLVGPRRVPARVPVEEDGDPAPAGK